MATRRPEPSCFWAAPGPLREAISGVFEELVANRVHGDELVGPARLVTVWVFVWCGVVMFVWGSTGTTRTGPVLAAEI
jgi:hypothetical protein